MSAFKNFFVGVREGQKVFGEGIAIIVNTVLLTIVYVLGVGATFLVAKLSRKKFLDLSLEKKKKTYWNELNLSKKPMEEYYRQF